MTVEDEREKRIEAIERRLAGTSGATGGTVEEELPVNHSSKVTSNRGAPKHRKFPGSGRTISGETVDGDDKDGDEPEGEFEGDDEPEDDTGSDFDEEYLSEEDEDDGEDAYGSEEESTARGGSSTYNLRAQSSKRKLSVEATDDSDDYDAGPTLRTRRKVVPRHSATADDNDDGDDDGDNGGSNDDEEDAQDDDEEDNI
ncbi:hypothetical protein IW152_004137 [Coemansia sp. BCRC 34962]|nr:hypothetical protein IW152_004137 [Coemansia sp. BCRC 34962]